MKKILAIPALLVLFSCNSQKPVHLSDATVKSDHCPPDGQCTVTVQQGKSMDIRTDEFGKLYFQLIDTPGKNVITYEYSRDVDTTLADAGYREQIVFEMDAAKPAMELNGFALANGKILFGRFCFCRGATGYYRVPDGKLTVDDGGGGINVRMDFKITEVPQVIDKIEFSIK